VGEVGLCTVAAIRKGSEMTTSKEHSGKVSSGGHWDTERSPARPAGDGECQTEE